MASNTDVAKPIVIVLVILLILGFIFVCIRRRRAVVLQERLAQQQVTPLDEVPDNGTGLYVCQYPLPSTGAPQMSSLAHPQPIVSYSVYYPPSLRQSSPAHSVYTMPEESTRAHSPVSTNGSHFGPAQDGSEGFTSVPPEQIGSPRSSENGSEVPSVPPPPYTPTIPK
ncbi:hypothetical protein BC939DRAFT_442321 [Gamsiella multidivaricata]|uniref:uncharacterized protein n=1 Tax=Gamsiella multidivaricata TaxID=101098 RepID=UPI00221F2014|nr:uncharacterized protein BC939DRAFT_442321 [Gamsiella multidivaricata]KAI7828932.1 hypothetical protein BC939DRAFT_442321 [Gamsiella multidivaricata]